MFIANVVASFCRVFFNGPNEFLFFVWRSIQYSREWSRAYWARIQEAFHISNSSSPREGSNWANGVLPACIKFCNCSCYIVLCFPLVLVMALLMEHSGLPFFDLIADIGILWRRHSLTKRKHDDFKLKSLPLCWRGSDMESNRNSI